MPEKRTLKRARQDKREGKSASTQAGEFVHEEIEHIREGKHGARSTKQAKTAARKRTASERSAAAKKAARTKGAKGRSEAARKAARTRARHEGGRAKHGGATAHA